MVSYYRLKHFGFALPAGTHVMPRSEFAAVDESERLLKEAETTCEDIRQKAKQAYEDEKRCGYEDGLAEGRMESIERLLRESSELDRSLINIERDLARLVAECVRKIIMKFDDTTRAEAVVRAALTQMRRERRAELRVSTRLHAHFRTQIDVILKDFPEVELVDVVEDSTLEPDRIILETSIGRVDGNIAKRLDDLEAVIRSAHGKESVDTLDEFGTADLEIQP